MEERYDQILTRGEYPFRRLNLKKGDLWIHDPRTLHRRRPNAAKSETGTGALLLAAVDQQYPPDRDLRSYTEWEPGQRGIAGQGSSWTSCLSHMPTHCG